MKFRLSAIIAIHFVLIHLWIVLFIHASEDENTKINFNFLPGITEDLEVNIQPSAIPIKLLHAISKHILSIMFTQYLTIHEILILRKSSTEFAILLFPNDKNTIMFCKNFHSKEMDEVPLTWLDLKYFLNESYISVFHKIKMFNIKGNQYVVLTHTTRDTQYISWHNNQTPYPKILFDNARKIFIEKNHTNSQLEYKQKEIYNNHGTAWAKITNQGKASFEQCEIDYFWNMSIPMYMGPKAGGNSKNIQSQLKNVQTIVSTYTVCASLLENGQVITWRDEKNQDGKISESIQFQLKNVKILISTRSAFAALLRNGNVIAWGDENRGGKIPKCKNVKMIFSNRGAFVALLNNGGVIAWGDENQGGKIPELIQFQLKM